MNKETDICIAGGGPAGMILALLLAKLGVRVTVLEQHRDFQREYRGEVLMPRFTQMMRQIGLFSELERCHHLKLTGLEGFYKNRLLMRIGIDDISPEAPFALWMPQPVLLNFLYEKAKKFPNFEILFDTSVVSLLRPGGTVYGVMGQNSRGEKITIRASVTVGADGRFSTVRRAGGFEVEDEDYRFDLLWFSIPKPKDYDDQVRFFLGGAKNYLILPKYPDQIQCGLVLAPGEYAALRKEGIESLRKILKTSQSLLHPFADSLKDFSPFNLLQARIDHVKQWAKDGVLLVGDAAHTCSPAGAIGVSIATATAIVAAEVLYDAVRNKDFSAAHLGRVQQLRQKEVKEIQQIQKNFTRAIFMQSRFSRYLVPPLLFLAVRSGLFRSLQRQLMTMQEPLPVGPGLHF